MGNDHIPVSSYTKYKYSNILSFYSPTKSKYDEKLCLKASSIYY